MIYGWEMESHFNELQADLKVELEQQGKSLEEIEKELKNLEEKYKAINEIEDLEKPSLIKVTGNIVLASLIFSFILVTGQFAVRRVILKLTSKPNIET